MPRTQRLRLDNVVTSMAELGPTIPDGGYSWLVFLGIIMIQITVPSVLSMYGVVLSYLHSDSEPDIYLWKGSVTLTPILFIAFWSLADPWSRTIVNLATVPRFVGLTGVALLAIGILASGYLETGGVGAYLARLSAGAVMGIGASTVLLQSENLLRRHFRTRLVLVLTLKRISFSLGIAMMPGYAYMLLQNTGLQTGLLLLSTALLPGILGACAFDAPVLQRTTPYRLLISEEDNELSIRETPEETLSFPNLEEEFRNETEENDGTTTGEPIPTPLFSEGSNSYSYDEPEDDINLFVTPSGSSTTTWLEEFRTLRLIKFWSAVVTWFSIKGCAFSLLVLSPSMAMTQGQGFTTLGQSVTLTTVIGLGTFLPGAASIWSPKTARWRSVYFGTMCWLGSAALWGIVSSSKHVWFLLWAFVGGVSIGGCSVAEESALRDLLGAKGANRALRGLSMIVGLALLFLIFIEDFSTCLRIVSIAELVGGGYWILTPCFGALRARWPKR
ncbi:uncharacterized protein LOC124181414 isoform X1 [Neodiprion fabricii]|uniref:uncharacterized protein LOC124181414 isoform X1 n=2 Tax=Neodiprion fabricii TaxID=2872261 RepID=UPI001ED8E89F|nr:uncharacterized protein LOC124181414 isoform X1 [Neodiprion fabricii]